MEQIELGARSSSPERIPSSRNQRQNVQGAFSRTIDSIHTQRHRNPQFSKRRTQKLREMLLRTEIRAMNQEVRKNERNDANFRFNNRQSVAVRCLSQSQFTKKSLGCISQNCKLRRCLVWLVTWKWFEYIILFFILFNTIVLMLYDYRADHYKYSSNRNQFVFYSGFLFTTVFTLEFLMKIIAMGFITHRNAYLRDAWNWLDFIVVVTGLLEFFPNIPNLKPLRVLRVFRPLRSIKSIESMRRLVGSLLKSLPNLANVILFLIFLFLLFGILGLQLFGYKQYNRCRTQPMPDQDGTWPIDPDIPDVCTQDGYGNFKCPVGLTCGNPSKFNLPLSKQGVKQNENINYGITNFDNIFSAMLTIFQMITLEGWAQMMYNLQDAMFPSVPSIYFCFLVVLGSFFLLNLILAVIMDSFDAVDSEKKKERQKKQKQAAQKEMNEDGRGNERMEINSDNIPSFMHSTTSLAAGVKNEPVEIRQQKALDAIAEICHTQEAAAETNRNSSKISLPLYAGQAIGKTGDQDVVNDIDSELNNARFKIVLSSLQRSQSEDRQSQLKTLRGISPRPISTDRGQPMQLSSIRRARQPVPHNAHPISVEMTDGDNQASENFNPSAEDREFSPDPEPEPVLQSDNILGEASPSQSRHPLPVLPQINVPLQSQESKNFTQTPLSTPHNAPIRTEEVDVKFDDHKAQDQHSEHRGEKEKQDNQFQSDEDEDPESFEIGSPESDSQNGAQRPKILDSKIPYWSQRNKCLLGLYKFVTHPAFNFIVLLAILGNTVVLAMDRHPISVEEYQALQNANLGLYCFFLAEMLLKLIGMGFKGYTKDHFNIFDGFIVILSTIEIIVSRSVSNTFVEGGALSAFRGFRLLRVFKIARSWTSFQGLLRKIGETLKDIWSFVILLLIVIFCFSMMGMEFFSFGAFFKYYDHTLLTNSADPDGVSPRLNFNNLLNSVTLIFVVLSGEDWQVIMYDYYRHFGVSAAIFFVALVVIGNFIFLNLFLAILLKDFEDPQSFVKAAKQDESQEDSRRKSFGWRHLVTTLKSVFKKKKGNPHLKRMGTSHALISKNQKARSGMSMPRSEAKSPRNKNESMPPVSGRKPSALITRQQTYHSSPSPPEKNQLTRSLKKQRPGEDPSEAYKQVQATSQFEMLPALIQGVVEYSELTRQRELEKNVDITMSQGAGGADTPAPLEEDQEQQKVNRTDQNDKTVDEIDEDQAKIFGKDLKLEQRIKGKSLWIFGPKNKFRWCLGRITTHKIFYTSIILLILGSSIILAIENPLDDPNGNKARILFIMDAWMTALFCLEAIMKIVAFGFLLGHKQTYLRDWWNVIDFLIVIFSVLSLCFSNSQTKALKAFRLLRVLRPLRVISRNEGLKLGVQSLLLSIPDILNVFIISMLFFLVFGIFCVNYFKGAFHYCEITLPVASAGLNVTMQSQHFVNPVVSVRNQAGCLAQGGEWLQRDANFDNTLNAILLLFEMSTTEGWVDVMFWGIEATGADKAPIKNNAPGWGLFFIFIFVVGSLFLINLFVGVVIRKFEQMKEILGKNFLLTNAQRQWISMRLMAFKFQPKVRIAEQIPHQCRRHLFNVTHSNGFQWFIMSCIFINTAIMAITWYGEPRVLVDILDSINYAFAGIFTIEAILKIIALGKMYFRDGWNCFDFTIVCGTLISILISQVTSLDIGTQATLVRAFRIGRIFRLIRRAKSLKMIFDTFIVTIPSLTNVGVILLLLIYIYAILGVNLFATVKLQEDLNRHANFQSFGTAFLTLMRVSTGQAWNSIMHDAVRQRSKIFDCKYNPTYDDIQANGGETNGCGSGFGYFYFCSFVVIVSFVYLNLFIAIILQGFSDTNERANLKINETVLQDFRQKWSLFDLKGKGLIRVYQLPKLIDELEPPLGLPQELKGNDDIKLQFLGSLKLTTYRDFTYFNFYEVLQALVRQSAIKEKVKEAVLFHRQKTQHRKGNDLLDQEKVTSQLKDEVSFLDNNGNHNKEAKIWKNMVKTERSVNKKIQKHGEPDNFGSEFIWAAFVIAKHIRKRIEARKLREGLKSIYEQESNRPQEDIRSQASSCAVRKISSMSRSPSKAVQALKKSESQPPAQIYPQESPRFSPLPKSNNDLYERVSPQAMQRIIATTNRSAFEGRPPSPFEKQMRRGSVSPNVPTPRNQSRRQSQRSGGLLPDFGLTTIDNTRCYHVETPPPVIGSDILSTSQGHISPSAVGALGSFINVDHQVRVINSHRSMQEEDILDSVEPPRQFAESSHKRSSPNKPDNLPGDRSKFSIPRKHFSRGLSGRE